MVIYLTIRSFLKDHKYENESHTKPLAYNTDKTVIKESCYRNGGLTRAPRCLQIKK
jgi:hypothetical protein